MKRKQAKAVQVSASNGQQIMVLALVLIVVMSAIGVVYSRHQSRHLFIELQRLEVIGDELAVEWDRLQLEEGTYSTHGIIEQKARTQLNMVMPSFQAVEHLRQ